MINRTIVATLIVGLASSAFAAQFASPAYDQATAATRGADTTYDGSVTRTAVQTQVSGSMTTGGLTVETPTTTGVRSDLTVSSIPEPSQDEPHAKGKFFTKRGFLFGAGGAAVGVGVGWLLGGPIGAVIGGFAGLAIGFFLSKILH